MSHEVERGAVAVAYDLVAERNPDHLTVGSDVPFLDPFLPLVSFELLAAACQVRINVVRVGDVGEGELMELIGAVAEQLTESVVHVKPASVWGQQSDTDGGVVECDAKTFALSESGVFGFLASRQIETRTDPALDLPFWAAKRGCKSRDPNNAAVGAQEAVFDDRVAACVRRRLPLTCHSFAIVRVKCHRPTVALRLLGAESRQLTPPLISEHAVTGSAADEDADGSVCRQRSEQFFVRSEHASHGLCLGALNRAAGR